jgi:glycosyltransferase involved in cell wall biosynthesis
VRIVHVTDCYLPRVGGIERQVHDLAQQQHQQGHEVRIVTSVAATSPHLDSEFAVCRPRPRWGGDERRIRYGWTASGRRVVLESAVDVVHIHASTMSPLAFATVAATARLGIPTVMTIHSLWAYASPLFRWADRAIGWRAWPVTWSAVSAAAAEPLRGVLGPHVPIAVLPNGVDAEAWRVQPAPREPGRIVVASVGRLAHRKRPRQLLRILRAARAAIPSDILLEAVIVGDGPLAGQLRRYLARHDMTSWVHLTGAAYPDEIREIHARADFYVAPAVLESFGIAASEARCAGLPVVAHRRTGIADYIADDVEGFLVVDDQQMVDRVVELATSPATLARIRAHNARTCPPIGWPDTIKLAETLYRRAIPHVCDDAETVQPAAVR